MKEKCKVRLALSEILLRSQCFLFLHQVCRKCLPANCCDKYEDLKDEVFKNRDKDKDKDQDDKIKALEDNIKRLEEGGTDGGNVR